MMAEQIKQLISAIEFLNLPETQQKQELIGGEIIVPPVSMPQHQRLVIRISRLLEELIPNGEVLISPADIYLHEETVVQPDIFWIAESGRCIETEKHFEGAPDLLVEVLSPSTAIQDKREKFAKYEAHGVREYWIVDPHAAYVEVWQLSENEFIRVGIFGKENSYKSELLNQEVIFESIF